MTITVHTGTIPQLPCHTWTMYQTNYSNQKLYSYMANFVLEENIVCDQKVELVVRWC